MKFKTRSFDGMMLGGGTIMEGLFPLKKQLGRKTNFVLGDQPRVLKVLL